MNESVTPSSHLAFLALQDVVIFKTEPKMCHQSRSLCSESRVSLRLYLNKTQLFLVQLSVTLHMVCVLQEVSGRIRLPQSRKKPKLRLHQLRQLRLGISVSFQTHDTRLLGKTLSSGGF